MQRYLLSISGRLTLVLIGITSLILFSFGGISYVKNKNESYLDLEDNTKLLQTRIQRSAPTAIWNMDNTILSQLVDAETSSEFINGIVITDVNKAVLYGKIRNASKAFEATKELPPPTGQYKEVKLNFENAGKTSPVGTAHIYISTEKIEKHLQESVYWLLAQVLVIDIFIGLGISFAVRSIVVKPLGNIRNALQDIAEGEGDLTKRLHSKRDDEFNDVVHWFNVFISRIQSVMREFRENSVALATAANELEAISNDVLQGSSSQADATASMSSTVDEVTVSINQIAQSAQDAQHLSMESEKILAEGVSVIEQTVSEINSISNIVNESAESIAQLGQHVDQIGSIVTVIQSIADQTNLLALNAAIEAARAGESGRGFAIVADEVRKLAEHTSNSTQEIRAKIELVRSGSASSGESMKKGVALVSRGVNLAHKTGEVIHRVREDSSKSKEWISYISGALEEQNIANTHMSEKVVHIRLTAEDNNRSTLSATKTAEELAQLAKSMQDHLNKFNVGS